MPQHSLGKAAALGVPLKHSYCKATPNPPHWRGEMKCIKRLSGITFQVLAHRKSKGSHRFTRLKKAETHGNMKPGHASNPCALQGQVIQGSGEQLHEPSQTLLLTSFCCLHWSRVTMSQQYGPVTHGSRGSCMLKIVSHAGFKRLAT